MFKDKKRWFKWIAAALILGAAAIFVWQRYFVKTEEGLASGNGRIEATDIDVAAKIPARTKEILVHDGDFVTAGQVVVMMDTDSLNAQLREAEAQLQRAQNIAATARSQVVQRQADCEPTLGRARSR
jgi:HlyD family secretion protein